MDRAKYVAKVSGLAIAAGVGVAMASGAGVAAADTGDSDSDSGASVSTSSGSDTKASAATRDSGSAGTVRGPRSIRQARVSARATAAESATSPSIRRFGTPSDSATADETLAAPPAGKGEAAALGDAPDPAATPGYASATSTAEAQDPVPVAPQPIASSVTTAVGITELPVPAKAPTTPAGAASFVEILGAARRDTESVIEVTSAALTMNAVSPAAVGVPVVLGVRTVASGNRFYRAGDTISIEVEFDREVIVSGTVTLALETGVTDRAVVAAPNATPSTMVRFDYVVREGDISWDLDYVSTNALSLAQGSIRDAVTNDEADVTLAAPGAAGSLGANSGAAVDGRAPSGTVVISDSSLKVGETALVVLTFSEAVVGFTNADVTVSNGSLSVLSSSDGGITWTGTFTPTANITDMVNVISVPAGGFTDAVGNPNTAVVSNTYAIDTQRPTATIVIGTTTVAAGQTAQVSFTFSEAVAGFTLADVTVPNGSLTGLSSIDGGITWTATFTPAANVVAATNWIALNNSGITDLAGNTGAGTTMSNHFAIGTQRPTATITVADTVLGNGQSTSVTFTFSQPVVGFTDADIAVANGTLSGLSSVDGVTWTATLTTGNGVGDATNVITVDMSGVTDAAGNAGEGTATSNNYAVEDDQSPTVAIALAATTMRWGQTTTVTFTFSEKVTGFGVDDVTVANGRLSELSSTDGGLTYTATLTPRRYIRDSTNVITLNGAAVTDAAGNPYRGPTVSANYALNTTPRGLGGYLWRAGDFVVNQVARPIGQFLYGLFFGR